MKRVLENRWIMIDAETLATWSATIASTKQMCVAMAAESLALDGRTLGETKFKAIKCNVTIEFSEEDLISLLDQSSGIYPDTQRKHSYKS